MKPNILFLDKPVESVKSKFLDLCNQVDNYKEADIIYTQMTPIDYLTTRIKAIICPCTGISHLPHQYPSNVKIIYLNDKDYLLKNAHSTAEYVISSIMLLMRVNEDELYHKKIGLIGGAGRVGRQVLKKLDGLTDFLPIVYDRVLVPEPYDKFCYQIWNLEELFKECDIISLHLDESPGNKNFLSTERFKQMVNHDVKYIINSARPSLISTDALLRNLMYFNGIVIDGLEGLPEKDKVCLKLAEKVGEKFETYRLIITNHTAGSMKPSRLATDNFVFNEFRQWLHGYTGCRCKEGACL